MMGGHRLRRGAAVLVAGVTIISCGGDDVDDATEPSPTDPPGPTEVVEITGMPSTSAAATTEPPEPVEPIPDDATLDELLDGANAMFEPTTDAVAELGRFIGVPTDVPSPIGARIEDFTVSVYADAPTPYHSSEVTLIAPGTPEDVATFYEAHLAAAGYVATGSSSSQDDETAYETLSFARPDSEVEEVEVRLVDSPNLDRYAISVDDEIDPAALRRFRAWPGELPGIEPGQLRQARVFTVSVGDVQSLSLMVDYVVPDTTPEAALDAFLAALPTDTYQVDPEQDEIGGTDLVRDRFDAIEVATSVDGDPDGARLRLTGLIYSR